MSWNGIFFACVWILLPHRPNYFQPHIRNKSGIKCIDSRFLSRNFGAVFQIRASVFVFYAQKVVISSECNLQWQRFDIAPSSPDSSTDISRQRTQQSQSRPKHRVAYYQKYAAPYIPPTQCGTNIFHYLNFSTPNPVPT